MTTRDSRALPRDCARVDVDAMRESEATELLAHGLEVGDRGPFPALARRLGGWPLLLKLVNGQLRELVEDDGLSVAAALDEVQEALDEAGLTAFDREDEAARESAVTRSLGVSLRRLGEDDSERFSALAVFPEDVDVPLAVIERGREARTMVAGDVPGRLYFLRLESSRG